MAPNASITRRRAAARWIQAKRERTAKVGGPSELDLHSGHVHRAIIATDEQNALLFSMRQIGYLPQRLVKFGPRGGSSMQRRRPEMRTIVGFIAASSLRSWLARSVALLLG